MRIALLKLFLIIMALSIQNTAANAQEKPRLNHIAIYVDNLETSAQFYRDVVGLDTIPEPFHDGRHAWFTLGGGGQLHVISGPGTPKEKNKNNHLCFSIPSVAEFTKKLDALKITFENWAGDKGQVTTRPDGIKQIWFRDPNGYWIEFNDDYK
ncbi:MAG: VOC family protein [Chitinophagaceae bacterium]|nr:VOC family protein [Chitinophagaceae bacterium]